MATEYGLLLSKLLPLRPMESESPRPQLVASPGPTAVSDCDPREESEEISRGQAVHWFDSPPTDSPWPGPAMDAVRRSIHFYWDPVVFQVEELLYKVPRARFIEGSPLFSTMFMLPQGSQREHSREGNSDERPIVLDGVAHQDFHQLVETLYPPLYPRTRSKVEWIGVLKLATTYQFQVARDHAVDQITRFLSEMRPLEKVNLGRKYYVSAWFLEGIRDMVARRDAPSAEDLSDFGSSIFVRLVKERERCREIGHRNHHLHQIPCSDPAYHVPELKIMFQPEFDAIAWHNAADKELDTIEPISNVPPASKGKGKKGSRR